MNLQSTISFSVILTFLIFWLLKNFFNKKLGSGQTLFWLLLLFGAETLVLFPELVIFLSVIWGNILPVSWITFVGLTFLILYLFYQTIIINKLNSQIVELTRNLAFLDEKLRKYSDN